MSKEIIPNPASLTLQEFVPTSIVDRFPTTLPDEVRIVINTHSDQKEIIYTQTYLPTKNTPFIYNLTYYPNSNTIKISILDDCRFVGIGSEPDVFPHDLSPVMSAYIGDFLRSYAVEDEF